MAARLSDPIYTGIPFFWRRLSHPLLQHRLNDDDASVIFASESNSTFRALVSDHVVAGRIIFPGVGYLEMARAAACNILELSATDAALHCVFFLQPLMAEAPDMHVQCALANGRFEIRSGMCATHAAMPETVNCSGAFVASGLESGQNPVEFEPVSYTHLTLPTICSV